MSPAKYLDIRHAPSRLRALAKVRGRKYLGHVVYGALDESGELETSLDAAVRSMRGSLERLISELREKGYTEQEAHDRAWESLLRHWPFKLDDGEPEKKESPEPLYGPIMPIGTAGNGDRAGCGSLTIFRNTSRTLCGPYLALHWKPRRATSPRRRHHRVHVEVGYDHPSYRQARGEDRGVSA